VSVIPPNTAQPATDLKAQLLDGARFEIVPTPDAAELTTVLQPGTTVHVMCPPLAGRQSGSVIIEGHLQGVDSAVAVATKVAGLGCRAVPHLAAKTVRSQSHLREVLARMANAGIDEAFVPGGDGADPAGPYDSAVALLEELGNMDHHLRAIGVGAYPEGHREIPDEVLVPALLRKQHVATFMVSEICFDPAHTLRWLAELRGSGVTLPLVVGVPGAVGLRMLTAQLKHWGVGSALRFLRKQHGMMGAVLTGRYSPAEIVEGIAPRADDPALGIQNIQFITLNDVASTEAWRRQALDGIGR
jgi:methylenetetrahydrofolate reductase (NADPH)